MNVISTADCSRKYNIAATIIAAYWLHLIQPRIAGSQLLHFFPSYNHLINYSFAYYIFDFRAKRHCLSNFDDISSQENGNCQLLNDIVCHANRCTILLQCEMEHNEECKNSYPETATLPCIGTADFGENLVNIMATPCNGKPECINDIGLNDLPLRQCSK